MRIFFFELSIYGLFALPSEMSMRLKKLVICGFKSFAEKAVLDFSPGITAVVGPNGCGKSNIVDSFRWVMGEQSARAIRGDKMLDILFAGSGQRKPTNMAEVTLTFTEVDGDLPVDFGEVSICRRVYRSGESEFFINRNPVRLKDIESLFWDTGLGKDAFCIFEQGKIEQLIQYTPLERRAIFEEAAGILRFKQRKKEALRKLEQAEVNFSRAQDIYLEIQKQCVTLEVQAVSAVNYKQNKTELEGLEKRLFLDKWDKIFQREQSLREQFEVEKAHYLTKTREKEECGVRLSEAKATLNGHNLNLKVCMEKLFHLKSQQEVKASEWKALHTQKDETEKKIHKCQRDLEQIKLRRLTSLDEFQKNSNLMQDYTVEVEELKAKVKEAKERFESFKHLIDELREMQKEIQQNRLKHSQQEIHIKSQLQENKMRLETKKERQEGLQGQLQKLEKQLQETKQAELEKRGLFEAASSMIDQKKKHLVQYEYEISLIQEELKKGQQEIKTLQHEKAEIHARRNALIRLKEDMEGLSSGTKRLLQETKKVNGPLAGKLKPLYELFSKEQELDAPRMAALRPYTQTLVVNRHEELNSVLQFAVQHQLKEFSLLCCDDLKASRELVEGELEEQTSLTTHFFHSTTVAERVEEIALKSCPKAQVSWLSKDGFFKDKLSVLFAPLDPEKNTFLRESEIKNLTRLLEQLEEKLLVLENKSSGLEEKKQLMQTERQELDKALRIQEMKLVEINFSLQNSLADQKKIVQNIEQMHQETKTIHEEMQQASSLICEWSEKEDQLRVELAEFQKNYQEIEVKLQENLSTIKEKEGELRAYEREFQSKNDSLQQCQRLCQVFRATDQEQEKQEINLQEEHLLFLEKNEELICKLKERSIELDDLKGVVQSSKQELDRAEAEFESCQKKIQQIEEADRKILDAMKELESQIHKKEILLAEDLALLKSMEEDCYHLNQCSVDEIRAEMALIQKPFEKGGIEKRAKELRRELEDAGDINLAAIEEFEKQKERENFFHQQLEDLQSSKQELIQIIGKLDDESRKMFEEIFGKIRTNFKKNFNLLFEGGEADLSFTESKDILEAGIEITAKPPGKQMRSISLLSGGEKCLTAMALLFAIFEVKPSAFCILDEVDAPLDEANVRRFTNMIRQFVDKTQFIIITHNKRTMSIADVLFGVSMEEKGVSKLLSLVFDKNNVHVTGH